MILSFLSLFCFIGCDVYGEKEVQGLNNFGKYNMSESEQFLYIIPEGFLDKYEYNKGNYYYSFRTYPGFYRYKEKSLIYLQYEPEVYEEAKAYVESEVKPFDENETLDEKTCGIYHFKIRYMRNTNMHMAAYFTAYSMNEETNTLLFIAFNSISFYEEAEKDAEDWDAFIRFYFQWYDFDK